MNAPVSISLAQWVEQLQAKGRNSFSLSEMRKYFVNDSEAAIKLKLTRLTQKGKILSIHKGFYLIISPQYASRGVIPPVLFIDHLMKYLERPYYVGLLNAAVFYGAGHQQPQELFIFTDLPTLRPTVKKGLKINYISTFFSDRFLEKRKTETGSITISSPELTAADLIQFEKRIGGLNRCGTVLNELTEAMKPERLNEAFVKEIPVAILQRLGYMLDRVLDSTELAGQLFETCKALSVPFFRIPLRKGARSNGYITDEKWKVIINTTIEIDE